MPRRRVPLPARVGLTAFVAVLIPAYWWVYGPANLLYFCDVAAVLTAVGFWFQSPLLVSMQAVAILVPQTVWVADFTATLFGRRLLGMTDYMFNPAYPQWVRALSLFHGWLPFLLLWAVHRVGYDRRALKYQTLAGVALLLVCYFAFAPPGTPAGGRRKPFNVNYVYGPDAKTRQTRLAAPAWFAVVVTVAVLGMFVPAHLALRQTMPPPRT